MGGPKRDTPREPGSHSVIICFHCRPALKAVLDNLVDSGEYKDYSQLIETAIENLRLLHEAGDVEHELIFAERARRVPPVPSSVPDSGEAGEGTLASQYASLRRETAWCDEYRPPSRASLSPVKHRTEVSVREWPWGQYNKFLPLKVTCRVAAHLIPDSKGSSSLSELRGALADLVPHVGAALVERDRRLGLNRDQSASHGFPTSTNPGEVAKSQRRFEDQFVGYTDREGRLHGMPSVFHMLDLSSDSNSGDPLVSLTPAGRAFAELPNPLLDHSESSPNRLSPNEIELLLDHIFSQIAPEASAYTTVLGAIAGGQNTPTLLDSFLRNLTMGTSHGELETTDAVLVTQRTGVLSRMVDLDLVLRERSGGRVTYALTPRGESLLSVQRSSEVSHD